MTQPQNAGGWGEDFTSCFDKRYAADGMRECRCGSPRTIHAVAAASTRPAGDYGDEGSGVVCTAWALLGLMAGECSDRAAVERGIRYLESRQLPDGDWPQEGISGVFNRACGITYTAYRNVFPIWALGRFRNSYRGGSGK